MNDEQSIVLLMLVVQMLNFINHILYHIPHLLLYLKGWWFLQEDECLLSSSFEMHIATLLG